MNFLLVTFKIWEIVSSLIKINPNNLSSHFLFHFIHCFSCLLWSDYNLLIFTYKPFKKISDIHKIAFRQSNLYLLRLCVFNLFDIFRKDWSHLNPLFRVEKMQSAYSYKLLQTHHTSPIKRSPKQILFWFNKEREGANERAPSGQKMRSRYGSVEPSSRRTSPACDVLSKHEQHNFQKCIRETLSAEWFIRV